MSKASLKKAAPAQAVEVAHTSESNLMDTITRLSDAGGSIIQIRTREPMRCAMSLRKHLINGEDVPYTEWDTVNGIRKFNKQNWQNHLTTGEDKGSFYAALLEPLEALRNSTSEVNKIPQKIHHFIYLDPQPFMEGNPLVAELIQMYSAILPPTNLCIILITNEAALPGIPVGLTLPADFSTPTFDELKKNFEKTLSQAKDNEKEFPDGIEVDEDEIDQIVHLGSGMSLHEFETYSAITVVKAGQENSRTLTAQHFLDGISEGKTAVVKQSEILELSHPEDVENVGGMGRLKRWLTQRAGCYTAEAKEFGIESPKGMVLVGVPGTGKSLTAKVTASVLGVPLIRMDIARVFSKYVGDSEQRIQAALKMVESMAPCVLFVDEVDKGLGGSESGGDSGTSSRVLGTFLTWLQDNKSPVFCVVTANRVAGLPPELLRHGRFDKIWSLGLPGSKDRREALAIHLRKRGRDIDTFEEAELQQFDERSNGYVPAEIESVVKDAIIAAYGDDEVEDVSMDHILTALKDMVPLSISNKEAIDRMVAWAQTNATPVHDEDSVKIPPQIVRPVGRNMRVRRGE